jgi:hypothetical protein
MFEFVACFVRNEQMRYAEAAHRKATKTPTTFMPSQARHHKHRT